MPSIQKDKHASVPFADKKEFKSIVMFVKSAINQDSNSESKALKLSVLTGLNTLKDVVTRSNQKQILKLHTIIMRPKIKTKKSVTKQRLYW